MEEEMRRDEHVFLMGEEVAEYDGAYTISWSAQTGATSYLLQERISTGTWGTVQNSAATSRAISGKTPGIWEYRVYSISAASTLRLISARRTAEACATAWDISASIRDSRRAFGSAVFVWPDRSW